MYNIPKFVLTKVVKLNYLFGIEIRTHDHCATGIPKKTKTFLNVGSLSYWYDFVSVRSMTFCVYRMIAKEFVLFQVCLLKILKGFK